MATSSIVRITQFLPGGAETNMQDNVAGTVCDMYIKDSTGANDSDYNLVHLQAISNPAPVSREGYITTDPDAEWSDSPDNNPGLNDRYRFGYGRFGTRYHNLDNVSGVMIHDRDFSVDGDISAYDVLFAGDGEVRDMPEEVSGSMGVQDHERKIGDVTINQYDFIVSASPIPFSYKNPVDSDVWIKLSNYVYPLASGTTTLLLDTEGRTPLNIVPFYTGLGGFTAKWNNDREFDYDAQVNVEWGVFDEDSPANQITFNYWFRTVKDFTGPRISNESPADNESGVLVDGCVVFDIRDYETSVNIDSLELYVNNIFIEHTDLTITEVDTSDGYSIRYCPSKPFLYGDDIAVSIYVEDLATEPNYVFHVYSFTTELSLPPVVVDNDPKACRKYKPITQDVSVDVVDGGHGLDKESIDMGVADETENPRLNPIIYRED